MPTTNILFVDNDNDFRKTLAEFLEQGGYQVIHAASRIEAQQALKAGGIDLAILDIRLENDDDEKDMSGMILAEEIPEFIPKIILTGYPTAEAVRKMLGVRPSGIPPAVDFVAKKQGPEDLLVSVCRAIGYARMGRSRAPRGIHFRSGKNRGIFVVHGHDEAAKEAVARFIEKMGLGATILSEQAGGSRTLIELLEQYSDQSFAVVLLTPDDVGYPKGKKPKPLTCRARQNVIFELGFFIGCLSRARVSCLFKKGVELPSDYRGVVYIPMDPAGGWKAKLAKDLEEAGFSINSQKLKRALQ